MKSFSPQHRDMMAVIILVIIICIAFPLIGSLTGSRVTSPTIVPTRTPTIVPTFTPEPSPTPESNLRHLHLRAVQVFSIYDLGFGVGTTVTFAQFTASNSTESNF